MMGDAASADDRWLRRLALQLAVLLPDERDRALAVLRHTERLVREFVDPVPSNATHVKLRVVQADSDELAAEGKEDRSLASSASSLTDTEVGSPATLPP